VARHPRRDHERQLKPELDKDLGNYMIKPEGNNVIAHMQVACQKQETP
jgi:hypothetical protein